MRDKARFMHGIKDNVGIIILAAGASSRLGQPKQLLKFEEKTFICRSVKAAQESNCLKPVVVLGANFEKIAGEIKDLDCEIVFNADWQTGMSSSIKTGVEKLLEVTPDISAVIISLCDQPLIKGIHFNQLIQKFIETNKPLITAFYNETYGVPALFAKKTFSELLNLHGDQGAKEIFRQNHDLVEKLYLPEAAFDVDTQEDFKKFNSNKLKKRQ